MKLLGKESVSDVIAHDVTPLTVNTDARAYSKLGWLIVLLGVGVLGERITGAGAFGATLVLGGLFLLAARAPRPVAAAATA